MQRRKVSHLIAHESLDKLYPSPLDWYDKPPTFQMNLTEFEELALQRVELLRILEMASHKGHRLYSEGWRACVKEDMKRAGLKRFARLIDVGSRAFERDFQARRADHISHFILRLGFCRSEELRRWFLNRELEWFRLRFMSLRKQQILDFLQQKNISYPMLTPTQKNNLRGVLCAITPIKKYEMTDFFRVPFMDVHLLVKCHKAIVKKGWALIPFTDLGLCIQSKYREKLSLALNTYYHRLPLFDDEKVNGLLEKMNCIHTGKNYNSLNKYESGVVLDPSLIDAHANMHFPLCMRNLHKTLRAKHHLKHMARQHYGLFLKGIGLSCEDAVAFWRKEMLRIMDSKKFESEYVYNIEYQYGRRGQMRQWTPYSCSKIIMSAPSLLEEHGCPFRHSPDSIIKLAAADRGFSYGAIEEVLHLKKQGHYQIACTKFYQYSHNGRGPTKAISHPNQYYIESVQDSKAPSK